MTDNSFFREVNEDLRSQRLRDFWTRFGWMIITAVVVIVAGTAAWRGWDYWQSRQAAAAGDQFLQAMTLADQGDTEGALAAFQNLAETGHGSYPALARMRAATLQAEAGEHRAAIEAFRALGEDEGVPVALREASRIRAAYLLVDHGSYDDVAAVVTTMTGEDHPMRHSAREALGLAAWKAGETDTARQHFDALVADEAAPAGAVGRAEVLLDLIAAGAPAAQLPAAEGETPPAAPATEAPGAPLLLDDIAPGLAPAPMPEDGTMEGDAPAAVAPEAGEPSVEEATPDGPATTETPATGDGPVEPAPTPPVN